MRKQLLPSIALLGLAGALGTQADLLVYEGFDYPAGTFLDGAGGGTGFKAPWIDYGDGGTLGAPPAPGGHRIEADSTSVGDGGLPNTWTGIPDGGYPNVGLFCLGERKNNNFGRRELDPAVVATFTSGSTTWMSFVTGHTNNGAQPDNHHKPNLAIGSGYMERDRARVATGPAIGGGGRAVGNGGGVLQACYWDDEDHSGTFPSEEHRSVATLGRKGPAQQLLVFKIEWDNVPIPAVDEVQLLDHTGAITLSDGVDTTSAFDPAGDPAAVKSRLETDITAIDNVTVTGTGTALDPFEITFLGGQSGTDVPQLVLGGTGTGLVTTDTEGSPATTADTVSLANFDISTDAGYTEPTEADFDSNAVSITSAGPLDQASFDTLSWHGSRTSVDEIRIGTTFNDLLSDQSTPPVVIALTIARNAGNLDFTWNSQDGMLYRLLSSNDLTLPFANWTQVEDNIPSNVPLGNTSIPKPGDPFLFYIVEEFVPPPVILLSESFDTTTAGSLPAGWTSGQYAPLTASPTIWELGTPSLVGPVPPGIPLPSASNCVGTDLDADYGGKVSGLGEPYTDIWLRTPTINLTGHTEGTLTFRQFKEIEDVPGDLDYGSIRILDASNNSVLASLEDRTVDDSTNGAWEEYSRILPAETFNVPIKIEFRFEADDLDSFVGWYVDDLTVSVPAP